LPAALPTTYITRNEIPVGYIEAKDVGTDLNGKVDKKQFDRYLQPVAQVSFPILFVPCKKRCHFMKYRSKIKSCA
jgi:hypothetical protein